MYHPHADVLYLLRRCHSSSLAASSPLETARPSTSHTSLPSPPLTHNEQQPPNAPLDASPPSMQSSARADHPRAHSAAHCSSSFAWHHMLRQRSSFLPAAPCVSMLQQQYQQVRRLAQAPQIWRVHHAAHHICGFPVTLGSTILCTIHKPA